MPLMQHPSHMPLPTVMHYITLWLCSYEFIYKQAVESTDAFLGMSGKDPSSTCCEDLVVRVELPEASSISGTQPTCVIAHKQRVVSRWCNSALACQ